MFVENFDYLLEDLLHDGIEQKLKYCLQIVEGLIYLEEFKENKKKSGIEILSLRNLTPKNIVVVNNGNEKICKILDLSSLFFEKGYVQEREIFWVDPVLYILFFLFFLFYLIIFFLFYLYFLFFIFYFIFYNFFIIFKKY